MAGTDWGFYGRQRELAQLIDILVALDDTRRVVRLGSCKRNVDRLVADLPRFDGHIERFLAVMPRFSRWTVEKVAVAPAHSESTRRAVEARGYIAQDLDDLTRGL